MIKVNVRNLDRIQKLLEEIPRGIKGECIQAFTDYLIGDESHGLRHYPPYRKVTRKQAYGVTFFSAKQRRWFFWALRTGRLQLPYARTNKLRDAWKKTGDKWRPIIRNETPYAHHVMSDDRQSRMSKKIGWMVMKDNIQLNYPGAVKAARLAMRQWLNRKGY